MDETQPLEPMADFFDARASGYDQHMRTNIFPEQLFAEFYQTLAAPITQAEQPVAILDLGCGTGLELEFLFERVPNAQVTGIDLSAQMLDQLRHRYRDRLDQITLLHGSYLTLPLQTAHYDYVISAMTIHHFRPQSKAALYRKIYGALKPGGKYIEGDSVTMAETEAEFLADYEAQLVTTPATDDGTYHIDLPLAVETQKRLLLEAGFQGFQLLWQQEEAALWNAAVYVVAKQA